MTDIVVLVIAADEGVKPQTVEAIKHSKAAKVPIIVAINKCDLPGADPQKIKNELLQYEIITEELSGDTLFVEISATTRKNLDKLKENIILQSELLDLKVDFRCKVLVELFWNLELTKEKDPCQLCTSNQRKFKKGRFFCKWKYMGKNKSDDK